MKLLILLGFVANVCSASNRQERRFPKDFLFGAATAAYQIEGGWNADDKGENIWDRMTHTNPDVIKDRTNGDDAVDSYTNYKRDVEMLRELGLDAYRLSLSWSRLLPNGLSNKISAAGVAFYNNYINEMLKYNITPIVTLYQWDLPQKLQDLGGFTNPLIAEWFEDYARVAYENFGDRVKYWITFNEPREICFGGYGSVHKAPILNVTDVGTYYCAKNLLTAHAKAYYAYVNDFKISQGGVCGIAIGLYISEPLTDSAEDIMAAEIKNQADWGLYIEPIYSIHGGFPKEFSEVVARKSAEQGYRRSRLPEFTDEEKDLVRGTWDFLGVNHYTGSFVSGTKNKENYSEPSLYADADIGYHIPAEWPKSASNWLRMAPNSMFKTLTYVYKKYNNPTVYITENGWSLRPEDGCEDDARIQYLRAMLNDALDAIETGVDLRGYMIWTLMDNFEWMEGFSESFGLYAVDFDSKLKTRTPRKSAFVYKQIVKTRVIDPSYEPDNRTMCIDDGH